MSVHDGPRVKRSCGHYSSITIALLATQEVRDVERELDQTMQTTPCIKCRVAGIKARKATETPPPAPAGEGILARMVREKGW